MHRIVVACLIVVLIGLAGIRQTGRSQAAGTSLIAIRPMERLNTPASEDNPCLSPDGLQFIYSSDASGKVGLYLASRSGPGQPLLPERQLDELATDGQVCGAFLTPRMADGWEYLFFSTQLNTDPKKPNIDIYRVGRFDPKRPFQGNNAASPVHVVCTETDEAFPWLSTDAKELYFSRKTEQSWQLMRAWGKEARVFTQVEKVDIPAGFYHACLNRARTKIIVQGPIAPGESRQGLFVLKRKSINDSWQTPEPLASINSTESRLGDCSPSLSFDTRYLYFASDRPGGKGKLDLYVVPVADVPELK